MSLRFLLSSSPYCFWSQLCVLVWLAYTVRLHNDKMKVEHQTLDFIMPAWVLHQIKQH